ncbi:hypothetical protein TWF694_008506 [Orbilia ellipsospora]|uniref:Ankyrin repeat protein n=1 Tax=Orbilia ellipsospora TaxID=2528407 RepID=A0AAV9XGA2_9PEZI
MAVIRALLRSKRMSEDKNQLEDPRGVEGHELDWMALHIDPALEPTPSTPPINVTKQEHLWYIVDLEPPSMRKEPETGIPPSSTSIWRDMVGFAPRPTNSSSGGNENNNTSSSNNYDYAQRAVEWIRSREMGDSGEGQPNKAARILHYRRRLACLTDDEVSEEEHRWDTEIREVAGRLKEAIEATAAHIFSGNMKLSGDWKDTKILVWSTTCQLDKSLKSDAERFPVCFLLYHDNGRWVISRHQLEAVLGLWQWSLKRGDNPKEAFSRKIFMVAEAGKKEELTSVIRLWITQTLPINEHETNSCPFPASTQTPSGSVTQADSPGFLPVLSIATSICLENTSKGRVILSTPAIVSPLKLIAQDIFTLFMNRVAGVIEPLKDVEPRTRRGQGTDLGISTNKPFFGLTEQNIEVLTEIFVAADLGTREDALVSIIPSLLHRQKLSLSEEVAQRSLHAAKVERQSGNLQKCEDILQGLLQFQDPNLETLVIQSIGELYRHSIRSSKKSDQELGHRVGVELSRRELLSDEAKAMQKYYKAVAEYLENSTNRQQTPPSQDIRDDEPWGNLERNLSQEEARPFGLLLMAKYDLSKAPRNRKQRVMEWAIQKNCPELIEDLRNITKSLSNIWDPLKDTNNPTPLFWAINVGCDAKTFQSVMDWPDVKIEWEDKEQKVPLVAAVIEGYVEHVRILLQAGADVNAQAGEYGSALQAASAGGYNNITELLLNKGAKINTQNGRYKNALGAAIAMGHDNIAELLLDQGADIDVPSGEYNNALAAAIAMGRDKIAELLLDRGADINSQSGKYNNALGAAIATGHDKVAELLLDRGADINVQSGEYNNALAAAIAMGRDKIAELLLIRGADINTQSGEYGNALGAAIAAGRDKVAELLLDRGADINAKFGIYGTALQAASYYGHEEIVKLLLDRGANIDARAGRCGTALRIASFRGHHGIAKLLLDRRAKQVNVNQQK